MGFHPYCDSVCVKSNKVPIFYFKTLPDEKNMAKEIVVQKSPYAVELKAGKNYAWCQCGKSAKQPFCDGSHKGTEWSPIVFKAEESKTVYLCGCKQTNGQPFCDGTHSSLP